MSVVNVLTPNGRRQNVKVQPNTTILQVLEEVCQKYKFDPDEHDLKHHKRIMDVSMMFRFSGLPNNAQLEMVSVQKKRTEQDVGLVVQLPDGTRLEGTYKPSAILGDILHELCPDERNATDLVVIYMRTEVTHEKLTETSLKTLGLVSGRAILRLIHRDPNAIKTQANVSSALPHRQQKVEESQNETKKFKPEETPKSETVDKVKEPEQVPQESAVKDSVVNENKASNSNDNITKEPESRKCDATETPSLTQTKTTTAEEAVPSTSDKVPETIKEEIPPIILGERSAVLFSLEATKSVNCDLPDSFFELNVNDIKDLLRQLRNEGAGNSDQPLLTAELRNLAESTKQLDRLNRYKKAIIRIQFPDRYVLQGTFGPMETVETVMEFVRTFIISSIQEFHLFTTPPKNILPKTSRLFEVNCVPSAVLHFGTNDKCDAILREDIRAKVSSPDASLSLALKERNVLNTNRTSSNEPEADISDSNVTAPKVNKKTYESKASTSSASSSNDRKLPKWFKQQ